MLSIFHYGFLQPNESYSDLKKKKKKEMYLKMHHDEVPDHGEPLTHDKGPTAEDSLIWILKK